MCVLVTSAYRAGGRLPPESICPAAWRQVFQKLVQPYCEHSHDDLFQSQIQAISEVADRPLVHGLKEMASILFTILSQMEENNHIVGARRIEMRLRYLNIMRLPRSSTVFLL